MKAGTEPDWGAFVPGPRCTRTPTGEGALRGARVAVKDLIDIGGEVTGGGNPDWARSHGAAPRDAWAVAALRSCGAAIVGKTITDELAFSLEGTNAFFGTPRNPRAPGHLPGGSSSGSAVSVAAGLADLALGTDTGGSVRIPASFCGVYGMRPSHGRIPLEGVMPFAPSYDTVGWMANDGALLQQAGRCLLGGETRNVRTLKLCLAVDAFELADPDCGQALLDCARQLGVACEVKAFEGEWRDWLQAYSVLQGLEIQSSLGKWIERERPRFGDAIAPRFAGAAALDPKLGEVWRPWREARRKHIQALLAPGIAWVLPSAPCTALPANVGAERLGWFYERALALGSIAGHAGLPQVTLPLARVGGLPVGLSVVAGAGQDESLLALLATVPRCFGP